MEDRQDRTVVLEALAAPRLPDGNQILGLGNAVGTWRGEAFEADVTAVARLGEDEERRNLSPSV